MLRSGGMAAFVVRPELLHSGSVRGFGAIRLTFVHPRRDRAAGRVVIVALKGRRTALSVAPPLIVHEADGTFTARARSILAGEGGLFDAIG